MNGKICDYIIEEIELLSEEGCNGKEISRLTGVSHSTSLRYSKRKGESETSYRQRLLNKKGISLREHRDKLAQEKGYRNYLDYSNKISFEKQEREPYQKLSEIVTEKIGFLISQGIYKNQSQIAKDIGFTRQTFNAIAKGKFFPRNSYLEKLCSGLGFNESEIKGLLEKKSR